MKKRTARLPALLLVFSIFVSFAVSAHAYFDPGTGSMLLQMLGVAFIAMGGFFVAFKNRIFAFFGRKKNKGATDDEAEDEAETDEDADELDEDAGDEAIGGAATPDDTDDPDDEGRAE